MLKTGCAMVAMVVGSTTGQIVHSAYGLDFLRVGDAGNRSTNSSEFFHLSARI
jgi:hypothetical protein